MYLPSYTELHSPHPPPLKTERINPLIQYVMIRDDFQSLHLLFSSMYTEVESNELHLLALL